MKTITICHLLYKKVDHIALYFKYDFPLKEHVKKFEGMRWVPEKKCWVVAYSEKDWNNLLNHLQKFEGLQVDVAAELQNEAIRRAMRPPNENELFIIENYRKYLFGKRYSQSTVMTYSSFLKDFLIYIDGKKFSELCNRDVGLYCEDILVPKGYSASTHRQFISAIKHFADLFPETGIDKVTIESPSKSKHLPVVLSQEEVIDILRNTRNLKHRTALAMLYSAGLRIGELINMELRDIDIDRKQVAVKQGKGCKDRYVVLADSFLPILQNYIVTYKPIQYLIEGKPGIQYSQSSVRATLNRSCKRAGITKNVTPHTLRHSYATHLHEHGIDIRQIKELLGHSRLETTMIYTHVTRKDLLQISSPLDMAVKDLREADKKDKNMLLSRNLNVKKK